MTPTSLAYLDQHYRSILFRGFHFLPERSGDGWVYWLPRYIHSHTSLKVYFLTNNNELLFLDRNKALHLITPQSLGSVDIFFGRTAGSFDPESKLIRSAKLKIVYPISSKIPDSYTGHDIVIIKDDTFIKPIPEHDRQFFYADSTKKEDFLLYPAAFYKLKGQMKFAKRISRSALKGKKIIFCGTTKTDSYRDECFSILKKKHIDFEYLNKVSKADLGDLYRKARLTIFLSNGDFNPRIYYESMACGTPCLLSNDVALASAMEPYAYRTSSLMLNRSIRKKTIYPDSVRQTLLNAAESLSEDVCYDQLFSHAVKQARTREQQEHA